MSKLMDDIRSGKGLPPISENSPKMESLLSAEPEIWDDGTLHISVDKEHLDKIGRVLVTEDGTMFCKQFYEDADSFPKREEVEESITEVEDGDIE